MNEKKDETHYNLKGLFKYITTVISWTIFVLLIIIGVLLIYYYISVRLYATKGDKFEPKFSVYTIVSQSMEPTISVYDVIINTKVDDIDDIKVNDVITFISTWQVTNGMTITHRVVGKKTLDDGTTCLVTRGDNNTQEDQACVKEGNIIGVTKAVIPGLGNIQFFLGSKLGWLLIIILPALYILVKKIIKLIVLSKEIQEENSKEIEEKRETKINEESYNKEHQKLYEAYEELKKVKSKNR